MPCSTSRHQDLRWDPGRASLPGHQRAPHPHNHEISAERGHTAHHWWVIRSGRVPPPAGFPAWPRHTGAQPLGIAVLGVVEHPGGGPRSTTVPRRNTSVSSVNWRTTAKVVADQKARDAGLVTNVAEQVEHRREDIYVHAQDLNVHAQDLHVRDDLVRGSRTAGRSPWSLDHTVVIAVSLHGIRPLVASRA
jgi:hypothetical protein